VGMGWEKEWDDGMGGRGLEGSELVRSSDSMCMYVRMDGMGGRGMGQAQENKVRTYFAFASEESRQRTKKFLWWEGARGWRVLEE